MLSTGLPASVIGTPGFIWMTVLPAMKIEMAGPGRNVAIGQHNCIAAGRTKSVFSFMQPQKGGDGEPAIIGF